MNAVRSLLIQSAIAMRWLTWPSSFFHELAHQLACYAVGHKVLEVRYIIRNDPNNVAGYVRHEGPPGVGKELLIGIAPLLMGLAIWAFYIALAIFLTSDRSLGLSDTLILIAATLVAANAAYSALPSPQDMSKRIPAALFPPDHTLLSLGGASMDNQLQLPLRFVGLDAMACHRSRRHRLRFV